MDIFLLIAFSVVLAAYTVAGIGDILLSIRINRRLNETITMARMINAKVEGFRKRVEALERAQANAPRLVSLKPTEKGGRK